MSGSIAQPADQIRTGSILLGANGESLRLIPVAGRRLGQWRVLLGDQGLPGDEAAAGGKAALNYVLLRMNAVPVGLRYPVLAVGDALTYESVREHLIADRAEPTMPVVLAGVAGLTEVSGQAWVYFLDRAQLAVVDELSRASGRRTLLPLGAGRSVTLHSGEELGAVYLYTAENGTEQGAMRYYDQLTPVRPRSGDDPTHLVRTANVTPDYVHREGQLTVRLGEADVALLSGPELVCVKPAHPRPDANRLAVVARLVPAGVPDGVAQADQGVRNAIGIEVGEEIAIAPATLHRARRLDRLIGTPGYVTCRVQSADLTTAEREVALVDGLTLALLGVTSGDDVVLEGIPETSGTVPTVRVKAFQASDEVMQRRTELSGGDFTCRFPSAVDSLGVFPDLPWVFLDSSTRTALGLTGQKLGTVRIRPSRSYQLGKEFREILLVLAVAFLGFGSVIDNTALLVGLLCALTVVITGVMVVRMRSRLSRRMRRRRG